MPAYYNEFDPHKAAWIRELIKMGLIAAGEVDTRSIADVQADDVRGFTQCHWFAGISVWSYALRQAGWEDSRPVWTGSCPCQSFSAAGKQLGKADPRHLWPAWFNIIKVCRPDTIFGEQVGAAIRHGWLDDLQDELEEEGYASGAVVFPACGIGAPHIRQRLYWVAERVADTKPSRCQCVPKQHTTGIQPTMDEETGSRGATGAHCTGFVGVANTSSATSQRNTGSLSGAETEVGRAGVADGDMRLGHPDGGDVVGLADTIIPDYRSQTKTADNWEQEADRPANQHSGCCSSLGRLANAKHDRGLRVSGLSDKPKEFSKHSDSLGSRHPGPTNGHWRDVDWLLCRDGKWRPVESIATEMADGLADELGYRSISGRYSLDPLKKDAKNRKLRLHGYGDAIVAPQAEAFIRAYMEASICQY